MPEEQGPDEVEAYEQDWYRSLRALAEHNERMGLTPIDDAERDQGALLTIDGQAGPGGTAFSQLDAEARKEVLVEAARSGLADELLASVRDALLDPDPEIRRLSLDALATRPADVDRQTVSRSLRDPDDEVRAAAVRLAAAGSTPNIVELVPLTSAGAGTRTRDATLAVLPGLIRRPAGLGPEAAAALFAIAAGLEPAEPRADHQAFGEIARAMGLERLVEIATDPAGEPDRRLGAANLLLVEGTTDRLAALTRLTIDEDERLRAVGLLAVERASQEPNQPEGIVPAAERSAGPAAAPTGEASATGGPAAPWEEGSEASGPLRESLAPSADPRSDATTEPPTRAGEPSPAVEPSALAQHLEPGSTEPRRAPGGPSGGSPGTTDAAPHEPLSPQAVPGPEAGLPRGEPAGSGAELPSPSVAPETEPAPSSEPPTEAGTLATAADDPPPGTPTGSAPAAQTGPDPHVAVPPGPEPASPQTPPPPAAHVDPPRSAAMPTAGQPTAVPGPQAGGVEHEAGSEMVAALARALHDPDDGVRNRARRTLAELDRGGVLAWARGALASGDPDEAVLAAWVAERVALAELAADLLHHAADPVARDRGPFVDALASFSMSQEHLRELLETSDPSRRASVARVLWDAASRAILPALRPHLTDADEDVRAVTLEILGESADPGAIEAAERAFASDPSSAVRTASIRVIAGADGHRRRAALEQAIRDPDPDVRYAALETLPKGLGEEADELVLRALADPEQRARTIEALRVSNPERLEQLALSRARALDPAERELAVGVLARLGTEQGTGAAMQALNDPSVEVRRAAAAALAGLRDPGSVKALGAALRDPEPAIRIEAVRALGLIDHESVLHHLVASLGDPDPSVRRVASEVLTTWHSPAVARRLAEVLANPQLRDQAADLLSRMGGAATELLVDVALYGDEGVRSIAGQLLDRIVGEERFLERLSSIDPEQRLRAIEALGVIGGPAAVAGVIRSTADPEPTVRLRAVELLGTSGDARAIEPVERCAVGDPVPEVATAAQAALRRLRGEAA
jgi:HEAT repeat protein